MGCLAAVLAAQDKVEFRSNVEIAVVSCAAVDASGAAVSGLTREEFRLYDNDVRMPIQNLWLDADLPLTLGILIDGSESQKGLLSEHRRTASGILERIMRPGDRAFVVSVDEEVRLWADMSGSAEEIRNRLEAGPGEPFGEPCPKQQGKIAGLGPWSTCGSSPIWNAVYDAARLKLKPLAQNKALLILTDGFGSGSTRTWKEAADAAIRADASVYAIQYKSDFGGSFAPDLYRLILEAAGTRFRPPEGDYGQIVSRMEADLRHRYVLGFRPERLSGRTRHDLRIEVTRPGVTIRARKTNFQEPRRAN